LETGTYRFSNGGKAAARISLCADYEDHCKAVLRPVRRITAARVEKKLMLRFDCGDGIQKF
jgi:hypothetical protein